MKNKGLQRFLVIVSSLLFVLWVLDIVIWDSSFNLDFYIKEFVSNDAISRTGYSIEELRTIFKGVLDYLAGNLDSMQYNDIFTDRELLHMVDVKYLFKLVDSLRFTLLLIPIVLTIPLSHLNDGYLEKRHLKEFVISTTIIVLILLGVCGLASINFDKSFVIFHKLFFNNDLWLLPSDSMLIKMLPQTLFAKIALIIVGKFMVVMGIVIFTGVCIERGVKE